MPSVWLSLESQETLTREATRTYPDETGGVLLGYRGETDAVVITRVVGPGPDAVHARYAFVPDHKYHDREVASIYRESGERWAYLGDWHSHPGGAADLSAEDSRTLHSIAAYPAARVREPLMLLMSGHPDAWRVTAFGLLVLPRRVRIQRLALISYDQPRKP